VFAIICSIHAFPHKDNGAVKAARLIVAELFRGLERVNKIIKKSFQRGA
jgi:hypothetical protein